MFLRSAAVAVAVATLCPLAVAAKFVLEPPFQ
jgi:hypothetical protein